MAMLLAFALLISAAPITASAETTYTPIGGTTSFIKNLVVDADANIPNITFTYSMRRGTAVPATDTTIEILVSETGGGTVGTASYSNADTENAIPGIPADEDRTYPTAGKKFVQKMI